MGGPRRLPSDVYARAERLLGPNLEPLVLNACPVPHWVGETETFWYRRELAGGHEFVLVDATTGARRAAFDHGAIAAALAEETDAPVQGDGLPFDRFEYVEGGRSVLFAVDGTEYVCPCAGGVVERRPAAGLPRGALLSPDGRVALLARDGNLWLHDRPSGDERALTDDGHADAGYGIWPDAYGSNAISRAKTAVADEPVGARWSPDGARIVVPFVDQRHVPPYPFVDSAPADGGLRPRLHSVRLPLVGERPATVEWYVIDVDDGARRRLDLPTARLLRLQADLLPIADVWWHAGGDRISVVAHGDNLESAFLFEADLETGDVRTVLEERLLPRTDLNTTSYNLPNVWVGHDGADVIWFSQRDGWGHLYRYDGRTGTLVNRLTRGEWVVRDLIRVDPGAGRAYFTAGGREGGNPYHRYLYRVNFDGSGLTLLTPETADHLVSPPRRLQFDPDSVEPHEALSPSGRHVVYTYSTVSEAPRCVVRAVDDGGLVSVVDVADTTALEAVGWRPPEEFVVQAADGETELYGVMYTPSDFDPDGSYPVLDAQYASPLIGVVPWNFMQACRQQPGLAQAAFAELGFVVVTVDGRGTAFRSRAFGHATSGQLETVGLEDHVAAIRQLAARHEAIDLGRVGIYGVSYGGYATVRALLEFPEFFTVGVATAGMAVLPAMYADYHWSAFHERPRYADGGEWRSGTAEIPSNWSVLDARQQASRLAGRLLLVLGELDENVPSAQMLQFVDALVAANRDFEMLYLPSRAHLLLREGYVLRRIWDFVVRNLLRAEPPPGYRLERGAY